MAINKQKIFKIFLKRAIAVACFIGFPHLVSAEVGVVDKLEILAALMKNDSTPQDVKQLVQWIVGPRADGAKLTEFDCDESKGQSLINGFYCLIRNEERVPGRDISNRILIEGHRDKTGIVIDTVKFL
jgi:hypothetical protein